MNICVFCASANHLDEKYKNDAIKLGQIIGQNGHTLVYGGANVGLMHMVAQNVKFQGAERIGVVAQVIKDNNVAATDDTKQIITPTMHERKAKMRELSDAFIALPGGFGTLEELLEVLTLKQLGVIKQPIVILNTDHYYDSLLSQFQKAVNEGISKEVYLNLFYETDSIDKAIDFLENDKKTNRKIETKWN
ncbi:TIGR00730 family Rossman fold protein [Halosquirtibacter laminarini]|uniref:TIGR00730 family Rossman fold protein n=1 Tax=Halosquirtibacter laminarini TaxID=3374600 RepID=A0AC61NMH9_9BACT|nr:TIGR00730 family Rossman fold protein [Prolixibacteraceae bacterium]